MKVPSDDKSTKIIKSVMNIALSEHVEMRVTYTDVASNVISIIFRLLTVIFNVNLACEYFRRGEILYFQLTLCFIFVPAFISIILSITL